jgi:hypothetical protein
MLRTVFLGGLLFNLGLLFDLGVTVRSGGYCSIWGLLWGLHYSALRLDLAFSLLPDLEPVCSLHLRVGDLGIRLTFDGLRYIVAVSSHRHVAWLAARDMVISTSWAA